MVFDYWLAGFVTAGLVAYLAYALFRPSSREGSRSSRRPLWTAEAGTDSPKPSNVVVMTHMRLTDWSLPNNDYTKERIARLERELEAA
jgi:hypothetical protein